MYLHNAILIISYHANSSNLTELRLITDTLVHRIALKVQLYDYGAHFSN